MAQSKETEGNSGYWEELGSRREQIRSVHAELMKGRGSTGRIIDSVGNLLSRPGFFVLLLVSHLLWVVANLPVMPWPLWDPYPFTFLATFASVEAPLIAILVLMHQDLDRKRDELTNETNLQFTLHLERQLSIALRLLRETHDHLRVASDVDPELLDRLQQELDVDEVVEQVRREDRDSTGGGPDETSERDEDR